MKPGGGDGKRKKFKNPWVLKPPPRGFNPPPPPPAPGGVEEGGIGVLSTPIPPPPPQDHIGQERSNSMFERPLQTRSTKTDEVQDCAAERPSYMNIYIYTLKGIWRFVVCETGGAKYKRNTSPSSMKTFHVAGFV